MNYFWGPDTYAARWEIDRIQNEKGATIRWIDREELDGVALRDLLDQAGNTLFGSQLVVIRDPSAMPKSIQEGIVEVISEEADIIVWDRVAPDKRSKLFRTLKVYGKEFAHLGRSELVNWLSEQVEASSGKADSGALVELIDRVGSDRWRLQNELEQISLRSKVITKELVQESFPSQDTQEEIFAMLDALGAKNKKRSIEIMEQLLRSGESEFYILSMLAYQFRTMLLIRRGQTKDLHPYVVQKNSAAAQRYGEQELLEILTRISATDFAIKQGKVDQRTALSMFVSGLS